MPFMKIWLERVSWIAPMLFPFLDRGFFRPAKMKRMEIEVRGWKKERRKIGSEDRKAEDGKEERRREL